MDKFRILTITFLFLCGAVFATEHGDTMDKPSFVASRTETMTAIVEAINHETREVTLKGSKGNSVTFTASEDAHNLSSVDVGDKVLAELYEEVSLSLHDSEGMVVGEGSVNATARTAKGQTPGGIMTNTVMINAKVAAINLEDNTFQLQDSQGTLTEFTARDPENLRRAKVGDMLVIRITQALGILIEQPMEE